MLKWFKSYAQGGFAQRIETKLVASLGKEICEEWHMKTNAISRGLNEFYLLS